MLTPSPSTRLSADKSVKRRTASSQIFRALGRDLNEAATVRRVAEVILAAADALLGWDAAALDLYSHELDADDCVLAMDFVEGRRAEVTPAKNGTAPSAKAREVLAQGAQIVLREDASPLAPNCVPFGNASRPSAA